MVGFLFWEGARHGYEAASYIWGQSFAFGFSFVVSKSQSFGFGFSFVTWEKLRLRNLTKPEFKRGIYNSWEAPGLRLRLQLRALKKLKLRLQLCAVKKSMLQFQLQLCDLIKASAS